MKNRLLSWIEEDQEKIVQFIQDFVRAKSPNPPGDTVSTMSVVKQLLDAHGMEYSIRAKNSVMPNLVATHEFVPGDRHLVLNGHIDVFPVENMGDWQFDPWAAEIHKGAIYGRGVADMKVGTTASLMTYIYLNRFKNLKGRLTLTVVSDEETFGPYGARYLFDDFSDEVLGTACLNGEPSSQHAVRFGERGGVWLRFLITTRGGHGAYAHLSPNAIELAYALLQDLRKFTQFKFDEPPEVTQALDLAKTAIEAANGKGAYQIARSISMNVGTMRAGPKVNMIASRCEFEVDFRLPIGSSTKNLFSYIDTLRDKHDFSYEVMMTSEPSWADPNSELANMVRANAAEVTGITPTNVVGIGNTDARLWRHRGVPAVVYGPAPLGMGSKDEHVAVQEALNVVKVHALSALDYLR